MHTPTRLHPILAAAAFVCCVMSGTASADEMKVKLSGDMEVPPVATMASGSGSITVNADMTVSGSITTTGLMATAAHIHVGKAGANGPVAVGLVKQGDNAWRVPDGAKLDAAQFNCLQGRRALRRTSILLPTRTGKSVAS